MSDTRPVFSRKNRIRVAREERDRMIARITGQDPTPSDAPAPDDPRDDSPTASQSPSRAPDITAPQPPEDVQDVQRAIRMERRHLRQQAREAESDLLRDDIAPNAPVSEPAAPPATADPEAQNTAPPTDEEPRPTTTDTGTDTGTDAGTDTDTDPGAPPQADAPQEVTEAGSFNTPPAPDELPQAELEPDPEVDSEPEPEPAPEPAPKPEPAALAAQDAPDPAPQVEPEAEAEVGPEAEVEPEVETAPAPLVLNGPHVQAPEDAPEVANEQPAPEAAPDTAIAPAVEDAIAPASAPASVAAPAPEAEPAPEPEPEPEPQQPQRGQLWDSLPSIAVDATHLERNLIITASRHDPAHGAFDVLRTRLVQTLVDNNWKRVAITSPTRDCGKTFTAVNLAISLSRYETNRTLLIDMDMRNPSVAKVLGVPDVGQMGDFLQDMVPVQDHFRRLGRNTLNIGSNLAVGMNSRAEPYAAELLQDPLTDKVLDRMMFDLDPDIVLYDLPPALAYDDVIAFRRCFDGILMVVGGGATKADEVREAMRRLGEDTPLLGVVLNQAEGEDEKSYAYG